MAELLNEQRDVTIVVSANDSQLIPINTTFLFVKSTTADFAVRVGSNRSAVQQADTILFNQPTIDGFEIIDTGGAGFTATLTVGRGEFKRNVFSGTVTVSGGSVTVTSGDISVTAGATFDSLADVSVAATTAAQIRAATANRQKLILTALDTNTREVRIGDSGVGAANGILLFPGQTETLETSAAVHCYNPHSAAQVVALAEIVK